MSKSDSDEEEYQKKTAVKRDKNKVVEEDIDVFSEQEESEDDRGAKVNNRLR